MHGGVRMRNVAEHHCPLCGHPLSAAEYERVMGVQKVKEQELLAYAKVKARSVEQTRAAATIRRLETNLKKAQIENEHLKRATTQGDVGRAWDGEMAAYIKSVFGPLGDQIEPTKGSRKGDVLVCIRHNGETICPIIVENKTSQTITQEFIRQTSRAKRYRGARYALLVSDGKRKGFEGGVKIEGDVILVKPAALISLLQIIREAHVELARAKASGERVDEVSQTLLAFVEGRQFRTPLEAILKTATDLETNLAREKSQVTRWWDTRETLYRQIGLDGESIRAAVHAILEGKSRRLTVVPARRARSAS